MRNVAANGMVKEKIGMKGNRERNSKKERENVKKTNKSRNN
jgi:hypothetical protein